MLSINVKPRDWTCQVTFGRIQSQNNYLFYSVDNPNRAAGLGPWSIPKQMEIFQGQMPYAWVDNARTANLAWDSGQANPQALIAFYSNQQIIHNDKMAKQQTQQSLVANAIQVLSVHNPQALNHYRGGRGYNRGRGAYHPYGGRWNSTPRDNQGRFIPRGGYNGYSQGNSYQGSWNAGRHCQTQAP